MVKINGVGYEADEKTVAQLVEEGGYTSAKVAVELNLEIVPKSKYSETLVHDGDSVEIVSFVGGG